MRDLKWPFVNRDCPKEGSRQRVFVAADMPRREWYAPNLHQIAGVAALAGNSLILGKRDVIIRQI